jgi:hypothetical protein
MLKNTKVFRWSLGNQHRLKLREKTGEYFNTVSPIYYHGYKKYPWLGVIGLSKHKAFVRL